MTKRSFRPLSLSYRVAGRELDRAFWLRAIADTVHDEPEQEHHAMFLIAARRIHAYHGVPEADRTRTAMERSGDSATSTFPGSSCAKGVQEEAPQDGGQGAGHGPRAAVGDDAG